MPGPPPADVRRPSRRRRLAFTLVAVVLGLWALEGAAWVAEPYVRPPQATIPTPGPQQLSPAFSERLRKDRGKMQHLPMIEREAEGWGLEPGTVRQEGSVTLRTNTLGLRGPEVGPRAADEGRLFTTGDSSIYGLGVQETYVFSSVAAAKLATTWGSPVSAVIGGVPGYDSRQSITQLRRLGPTVRPTWVVIANMWSDIYDIRQVDDAHTALLTGPRRFATWRVGRLLLAPWLVSRKVTWAESRGQIGDDAHTRVPLADYLTNLAGMAAEARTLGARPVYVMLPAPMDLDAAPVPETVLAFREAMRRVAEREDAPLLDGPALFRSRGVGLGYWNDQVHPSPEGHQLLGEGLAALLGPLGSGSGATTVE